MLLVLPGLLIVSIFNPKFSLTMRIIAGTIIWHFVFISGSVIFDLLNLKIYAWFYTFMLLSIAVTLSSIVKIVCSKRNLLSKSYVNRSLLFFKSDFSSKQIFGKIIGIMFVSLFILYLSISIYFEPILTNWDAVVYYLPFTKSILLTGSMKGDSIYAPNVFSATPPVVPLMYSWVSWFSSGQFDLTTIRIVPIMYLLLIILVTYKIGETLTRNEYGGIGAVILYLSLPSTQYLFIKEPLYLEPAFTFYLLSSLYFTLLCISQLAGSSNQFSYFTVLQTIMSLVLCSLTKEIAVLIIFLTASAVVAAFVMPTKKRLLISLLIKSLLMYTPLLTWHVLNLGTYVVNIKGSYEIFSSPTLLLRSGILAGYLLLSLIINYYKVKRQTLYCKSSLRPILVSLPILLITISYYLKNIIYYGVVSHEFLRVGDIYEQKLISYNLVYFSEKVGSLQDYIAYDKFFFSFFGAGLIFPPFLIGIVHILKNKDYPSLLLVDWLMVFLCFWSVYLKCPYFAHNYRFLYYLCLPAIFISTYGIYAMASLSKNFNKQLQTILYMILAINVNLAFVWTYFTNGEIIPAKALLNMSFKEPSAINVLYTSLPWLVLLNSPNKSLPSLFRTSKRFAKILFSITVIVATILLPSILLLHQTSFISSWIDEFDPNDPNSALSISGGYFKYVELINYYIQNDKVIGNSCTLSYEPFGSIARLFSGKCFINIQIRTDRLKVAPYLIESNLTKALAGLHKIGVRFILLPKQKDPILEFYINRSPLLKSLYSSSLTTAPCNHVKIRKEFKSFTLYEIVK